MSAAEKQRRYRARRDADPSRRAQYLEKQREAWYRLIRLGNVKPITELSEREKQSKRDKWRKAQQRRRQKKRMLENIITPADSLEFDQPPEESR